MGEQMKQQAVQINLKRKLMSSAWGLVFVFCLYSPTGYANPTGATAVSGSVLLSNPSANVLQVVNTPGAIINWNNFSIASGETTRFVQLDAASAVLNRVTGGNPSSILGRLESNGRVFLVNPNGVVFGGSSVVDVAGLIASTRDISNENFTSGNYSFSGTGQANITVEDNARIQTSGTGGQVWLIANNVHTQASSHIETPDGQVVLAAAPGVTVGTTDLGAMSFHVQTDAENTINAMGEIIAQRGAVGFFADAINFGGKVLARSNTEGKGQITAQATSEINVGMDARLDVSADGNAEAGSIHLEAARTIEVHPGSEVLAESLAGQGGSILLKAYQVDLPASRHVPSGEEYWAYIWNETNQSVRAFGVNAVRDGTVTVEETGSFNSVTTVIDGASRQSMDVQTSSANPCCDYQAISQYSGLAGDNAVLYYVASYPEQPPIGQLQTQGAEQEFFLVRDGHTTSLGALVPNGPPGQDNAVRGMWGLSNEGWVVLAQDGISQSMTVRIVKADGSVGATWSAADVLWSIVPLPSGAVWVRQIAFDETTELASRVYSATGNLLTGDDRTAALGSVRTVDATRLAGASASGGTFKRRIISDIDTPVGGGWEREIVFMYDAMQGSRVVTSLPQSQYQELYVSNENFSESLLSYFPTTGLGGEGALVNIWSNSEQKSTQGITLDRRVSWDTSLARLTRSPVALPNAAASVTGSIGQSAVFDTRPGLATNTEVPLPPPPSGDSNPAPASSTSENDPPTVVRGTGTGASFAGIAGCQTAVCLDLVNSSTRIVDAIRASQRISMQSLIPATGFGLPNITPIANQTVDEELEARRRQFRAGIYDEELAADAVMALAKAARRPVPDWETAMGVSNMLRDNGEMLRLVAGGSGFLDGTPEQRYEHVQAWIQREQNLQKLEVDTGNPVQDITIANIGANISDPQVFREFVDNFITPLFQGLPVQLGGD
jgi:filamentous hemagglutinin family protein